MFFLSSPLEQFQILPIIPINIGIFDFSITNASIILAIGLGSFVFVLYSLLSEEGNFYIVPNRIQYIIEVIYSVVYGLLNDNVGSIGKSFFPYVFTLFTFVLISNWVSSLQFYCYQSSNRNFCFSFYDFCRN